MLNGTHAINVCTYACNDNQSFIIPISWHNFYNTLDAAFSYNILHCYLDVFLAYHSSNVILCKYKVFMSNIWCYCPTRSYFLKIRNHDVYLYVESVNKINLYIN